MNTVAAAFVKAQKEFGPALKSSTNPHFKSKYADLAACVEAVIDALNNNGIAMIQKTEPSDSGVIVETVFLHESGETMSSGKLHVPAAKHDPQGYGSALTYARRYSLMAACGIAPEDDDGNAATKTTKKQPVNYDQNAHIPAKKGIGENYPDDWKKYFKDLGDAINDEVAKGDVANANFLMYQDVAQIPEWMDDWEIYLGNFMTPATRKALKAFNQPKAA